MTWNLKSWQSRPIQQQPRYPNAQELESVTETIRSYPPLVFAGEVETLKKRLSAVAEGKQFLLQGGDCAERFQDCNSDAVTRKLKILLQMSVTLCYGARKPVLRIGRIAGQYGKPRSADTETVGGVDMPVYRGDSVNGFEPTLEARQPDPERLLKSFHHSALTLNYIRALTTGGFADLHYPENWNLRFVDHAQQKARYTEIVDNIRNAISFMESLGNSNEKLGSVEFYTSHEGLLLPYEEALTRPVRKYNDKYFNLGAHMLWIGDRTRQLDGAHIEFFRGIENPIGIKVGPSADPKEIIQIIQALNPKNKTGKVVLITRFGADKVEQHLPQIIEAVKHSENSVVWTSDPMHGNATKTEQGVKTRNFDSILSEIKSSFQIHKQMDTYLGGVHFELTGENVTECIGGSENIKETDLDKKYETYCDPRLNYSQSLELAFHVSDLLSQMR